ncbi:hypothetical protein BGX31_007363, partial [Mortierella sp. GBA43]
YGPLIQEFPSLDEVARVLQPPTPDTQDSSQVTTGQNDEPTEYQLLTHLFNHCPDVQFTSVELKNSHIGSNDARKAAIAFGLPRARHVMFSGSLEANRAEYSKLKDLLSQCSTVLKSLEIALITRDAGKKEDEEEALEDDRQTEWTSIKELSLDVYTKNSNTEVFWSWLWKQCRQVEKLDILTVTEHYIVQSLARGMLNHMPRLNDITFAGGDDVEFYLNDNEVARLLSGSRTGWKRVIMLNSTCEKAAMDTLANHFSTLEELNLDGCSIDAIDLVRVLRSCRRLRRMTNTNTYLLRQIGSHCIDANAFVDRDPETGKLVIWACEASLKCLKVQIAGIPRPDLANSSAGEAYSGQGHEIQRQVYDRFARLTNLETLWLGNQLHYEVQEQCLEMSLESGLHKLSGLKKLRKVSFSGMRTNIGVAEVQWMTEHWPGLRALYGIGNGEDDKRAMEWLQKHYPRILVPTMWHHS